ncbi:MAG TPA: tyrosine-protein phosphatase [Tepidisphaeraceae bacterium]|nr:tyrosine-protein phosphatase [Tepidisphaeraceae bacterium]
MFPGRAMLPILLLIAAVAVAAGVWTWRQYFDAYHLATVRQGVLYRDGVRSIGQFAAAMRRVSPKTVVCLVDDQEMAHDPFASELEYCRANHIDLVRIPVPLGGWPTSEQVRQFLAIAADPARQPVLVHCAQGVRRTGMMVAAYQESIMNFDRAKAKAALLDFGHSQRTVGDVERFIDIYDPVARRMLASLPMSQE